METDRLKIISRNTQILFEQGALLKILSKIGVTAVVVGEPAFAVYSNNHLYQFLQDIELYFMDEKQENVSRICLENGYKSFSLPEDNGECIHLIRNDVTFHCYIGLSLFRDVEKDKLFGQWIQNCGIRMAKIEQFSFPMFEDSVNGILMLCLIRNGMERRKVSRNLLSDWASFVNAWPEDRSWESFLEKVEQFGLSEIAAQATAFGLQEGLISRNIPWCGDCSEALKKYIYYNEKKSQKEKIESGTAWSRLKHSAYEWIRKSALRPFFYYASDFLFVLEAKLQGRAKIDLADAEEVERLVTFTYKSFNRQRQAKRLYRSIRAYYPKARIIIADDSKVPLDLPNVIHLPFNSGLSKGLAVALDAVETPYVVRLDDDMLLTPGTKIHEELKFLIRHPEVDLVAVAADHRKSEEYAKKFTRIKFRKKLLISAGTNIDGRIVVYKAPNCFLARTEKLRKVGYDPNLRIIEHAEFFYRAAGQIVSVIDPDAGVMHCHNRFEKEDYEKHRNDTWEAGKYLANKHRSQYQL